MANVDNYGLRLSTPSDQAAELYREGVILMRAGWPGAAGNLAAAIRTDSRFRLGARGARDDAEALIALTRWRARLAA